MNDSIPGFRHHRAGPLPRPRHLRPRTSIPSRCAGGSGWSSRSPTRSRSRSTTTSPGRRGSSACKAGLDERVEKALRSAALWDEVKDRLRESALGLSGGQQQRLCIARAIAIEPDVLLLDEPASALDPIATASIEELMHDLKRDYTIVIVTHNMQQAARVADRTAFFSLDAATSSAPACSSSTTTPRRCSAARRSAHAGLRHRPLRLSAC